MSTIVHLVRHGEVFNPDRILYGRLPGYHLSDRGRAMASTTARAFTGHDVTVLKASPLTRAQETAQPFQQVTALTSSLMMSSLRLGMTSKATVSKGGARSCGIRPCGII